MRGMFGFVSLLVILAAVGWVAKAQLRSAQPAYARAHAAAASAAGLEGTDRARGLAQDQASAADPMTSGSQPRNSIQQQVAADAASALSRGAERNERAEQADR